jgi:uncharacterized protein YuzB (UPF0349 family)
MKPIRKVEVCTNNLEHSTESVIEAVQKKFPEVEIGQWECMGYCDGCVLAPYVLCNDVEYMESDSPEELLAKLITRIEAGRSEAGA